MAVTRGMWPLQNTLQTMPIWCLLPQGGTGRQATATPPTSGLALNTGTQPCKGEHRQVVVTVPLPVGHCVSLLTRARRYWSRGNQWPLRTHWLQSPVLRLLQLHLPRKLKRGSEQWQSPLLSPLLLRRPRDFQQVSKLVRSPLLSHLRLHQKQALQTCSPTSQWKTSGSANSWRK